MALTIGQLASHAGVDLGFSVEEIARTRAVPAGSDVPPAPGVVAGRSDDSGASHGPPEAT